MKENKRIVEIDGIKVEVDLRSARRIDTFRVGDNVKVLEDNKVKSGVVVDFANFKELPTIVIAVFYDGDYWSKPTIKFIYYNKETSEKYDIVYCCDDEITISKDGVIENFEREIDKKKNEMLDLQNQLDCFKKHFIKSQKSEMSFEEMLGE